MPGADCRAEAGIHTPSGVNRITPEGDGTARENTDRECSGSTIHGS